MNRHWSIFGLLAFVAFAPGCGPDIQGLCEEQERCLGGNDADIDACVAASDGIRGNAHDIGCGDEYDAYVECISARFECMTTNTCASNSECDGSACVGGECKRYGIDPMNADVCQAEIAAYSRCD